MEDILKQSRILIVDDQEMNILFLHDYLEMMGYTDIHTMTDAREIFDFCENQKPDLILLDLMMPKLSGYEVLEQLAPMRSDGIFLPILVLTADATNEAKKKALTLGATDFLTKPFDLNEVGLRIKNLLYTRSLVQQLHAINYGLEEKVRERTQSLEQTNEALRKALKRAATSDELKTAFMNNISHEVRTPLNGILGFSSLLLDPDLSTEEKEEFAPHLQQSADRLVQTITDYMDISLLVSEGIEVHKKAFNLIKMMDELYGIYTSKFDAPSIAFKLEMGENLPENITTDEELLTKSLKHLLDNAFKFTKEGSIVLGVNVHNQSNLRFFVSDTGRGIPTDKQSVIFESFMQADVSNTRAHEGSGLGLALVKGFLQLLNTEVVIESEEGVGSRFTFDLDISGNANQSLRDKEIAAEYDGFPLPALMVVDDEETHHTLLEMILKRMSPKIYHAMNGQEAIELINANQEIELIFMDIKMPVLNGLDTSKAIRENGSDVKIVAMTAYAMHGDQSRASQSGVDHYITKPVTKPQLLNSLKKMGYNLND